jgi:hypothetical protein
METTADYSRRAVIILATFTVVTVMWATRLLGLSIYMLKRNNRLGD